MGCVDPVGEAGGDIARMGALAAGFGDTVPGVQINRFCASGLDSVNFAAAQVMSGQHDLTIGGGVESMSRVGIGASGGAWPADPSLAIPAYFMPQGVSADLIATKYGFSRDDVDAYAVESQKRAAAAWKEGRFKNSIAPVLDVNGLPLLERDEHMRPSTDMQSLASPQAFVRHSRRARRLRRGRHSGASGCRAHHPCPSRRQFVGHRRRRRGGAVGLARGGRESGPQAARKNPRFRQHRLRARDHADRTGRRDQEGARALGHVDRRHRPLRDQRGFRLGRAALPPGVRPRRQQGQRQRRRDRDGPSARRDRRDDPRHGARRARAHRQEHGAHHACASAAAWAPPRSSSASDRETEFLT